MQRIKQIQHFHIARLGKMNLVHRILRVQVPIGILHGAVHIGKGQAKLFGQRLHPPVRLPDILQSARDPPGKRGVTPVPRRQG